MVRGRSPTHHHHHHSSEYHITICPQGFTKIGEAVTLFQVPIDGTVLVGLSSCRVLDESEYWNASNNTILFSDELVEILMIHSAGQPVVCINSNVSLNFPELVVSEQFTNV